MTQPLTHDPQLLNRLYNELGNLSGLSVAALCKKNLGELAEIRWKCPDWDRCNELVYKINAARGHDPFPTFLRVGNLSNLDYDDCVSLWVNWKPFSHQDLPDHIGRNNSGILWRRPFIDRLQAGSTNWRSIMTAAVRKLPSSDRDLIDSKFGTGQANSDPLKYLNLCGVPVLNLLSILDRAEIRLRAVPAIAKSLVEDRNRVKRALAREKKSLLNYSALFSFYRKDLDDLLKSLAAHETEIDRYFGAVELLINLKEKKPTNKRRVSEGAEFAYTIKQLGAECLCAMSGTTDQSGRLNFDYEILKDIRCRDLADAQRADAIAHLEIETKELGSPWNRSILGALACLVKAAFPAQLGSDDSDKILRKVKEAWNQKHPILLASHEEMQFIDYFKNNIRKLPLMAGWKSLGDKEDSSSVKRRAHPVRRRSSTPPRSAARFPVGR